jgi:hypothetical protein
MSGPGGPDQFIELQLHRLALPILGIANQEDHQKSYDSGDGVDNQEPGIAKAKHWASKSPNDYGADRHAKRPGMATRLRHHSGKFLKTSQKSGT